MDIINLYFKKNYLFIRFMDFWLIRIRSFTAPYCPHTVLLKNGCAAFRAEAEFWILALNCDIKLDFAAFRYFLKRVFEFQTLFT